MTCTVAALISYHKIDIPCDICSKIIELQYVHLLAILKLIELMFHVLDYALPVGWEAKSIS